MPVFIALGSFLGGVLMMIIGGYGPISDTTRVVGLLPVPMLILAFSLASKKQMLGRSFGEFRVVLLVTGRHPQ